MRRMPLLVLLAAWSSLAAAPQAPPAGSESIRVMPLPRDGQVYVSFELAGGVTDELRETIRSGLQTSFAYDFELRRGVPLWVDRTIAIATVVAHGAVRQPDAPAPALAVDRRPRRSGAGDRGPGTRSTAG